MTILLIRLDEAPVDELFGGEGLDDAKPPEGLLDLANELTPLVLCLEAGALEALAHTPHDEARQRQY